MKRMITISGILLFFTILTFGQKTEFKFNEIVKQNRVKNHSELLKQHRNNDRHNSFHPINRNLLQSSLLKSTLLSKQRLDSYLSQDWNDISGQWEDSYKNAFTYDANGNATELTYFEWNGTQWDNPYKSVFSYDSNGNMTQYTEYQLNGSQWENIYKSVYTYDSNGNNIQSIDYTWDGNLWDNAYKYEYTYNSNGNMTQEIEYQWDGFQWGNLYKSDHTYDSNGKKTHSIEYTWNVSLWGNDYKSDFTYDSNGYMTEELDYQWNGSLWGNSYKSDYTYNSNGSMAQYIEYKWNGSLWGNSYESGFTYNNSYSFSDLIIPVFLTDETSLLFNRMLISFEDNEWDNTLGQWFKMKTTMYYSEQSITSVSEINKPTVNVYPNPVSENLSFNFSANYGQLTFHLFDLQGRKVLSKEIKSADNLSLKGLTKGMYFYSLIINGQKQNGKLIKE